MGKRRSLAPAGSAAASISSALFSRTQQRVLSLLFGQAERSFTISELISLAGSGSGAVQREVKRLVDSRLVMSSGAGRYKHYRANSDAPIFGELRAIVEKTAGVAEQLRSTLTRLGARVQFAVLYGSLAKASDTATSDIDVLLVSDALTLEEVFDALGEAERRLGRRVSPTLHTSDEFRRRRQSRHPFLTRVFEGKHMVLVGSEHH